MAQKDLAENTLISFNDVFADVFNVFVFDGDQTVKESELGETSPYSTYFTDENLREQERDISKIWNGNFLKIAKLNIENQTDDQFDMPVRVMSYDSAAYRNQMGQTSKRNPYYPVITMVLYFGYEHPWKAPKCLYQCMEVPDIIKPYVNNYQINVIELAFITDEQLKQFRSDFKYVADYLVQMRKSRNYVPSSETMSHYYEVCYLLSELTGDKRFENTAEEFHESKKGTASMCEVLDRIENRGIEKGKFILSLNLVNKGLISIDVAADECGVSREQYIIFMNEQNA